MDSSKKIAIYSRKSKFTGKGESIENQIEICRSYIKLNYPDTSEDDIVVFEDEGFSGGNTNRPQFKKMMSMIKKDEICAVICYKLDRISRNVGDFALMYKEFEEHHVDFSSTSEHYDTSTPSGKAMISMCIVFAQMERETIAERIRDNMHELAKTGRWLGGVTPTGYKSTPITGSVTVDGKTRKAYKLDIINDEAEIVKTIFKEFLNSNSLTKVDTYLLNNGIKTKNGKAFTRFSIKSILTNPCYLIADRDAWNYFNDKGIEIYSDEVFFDGSHGIMAYNKTLQKNGQKNEAKEMSEWIIAVGKHKGLIDGKTWVQVQHMLDQNKSKSFHKPRSNVALLSGVLVCGDCGSFMRPKLSQRVNDKGEKKYSYLCETKERSRCKLCNSKNPDGNELDELVVNSVKKLAEDSTEFIKGLNNSKADFSEESSDIKSKAEQLQKEYDDTEKSIKSLTTKLTHLDENDTVYPIFLETVHEYIEQKKTLSAQLEEVNSLLNSKSYTTDDMEILTDMLKNFSKAVDSMTVEQKRMSIRTFVRKIVWDGENAHILLFGSDDGEIDFYGLSKPLCDYSK